MADELAYTENPLNNAGAAILELVNLVLDYGVDIRIKKTCRKAQPGMPRQDDSCHRT